MPGGARQADPYPARPDRLPASSARHCRGWLSSPRRRRVGATATNRCASAVRLRLSTGGVRRLTASVTAGNEALSSYAQSRLPAEGERGKTTGSTDAGTTTGCSVSWGRAMRRSAPPVTGWGSQDQRNIPPETSTRCAFIHASSSLSRAAMASPISSGSPTRPSVVWAAICRFTLRRYRAPPAAKVGLNGTRRDDVH